MMSKNGTASLSKKQWASVFGIVFAILLVGAGMVTLMALALRSDSPAQGVASDTSAQYSYSKVEASNGFIVHYLKTKPANVKLEVINSTVADSGYVGINGGFFYNGQLLSVGVVNGQPVNKSFGKPGDGSENVRYARGTLVYDGQANYISVQIVSQASEVKVKDHTRFWAQGGISMSLNDDEGWYSQAILENAPFPDEDRLRSAAVYDMSGSLYLIVSETKGSLEQFRAAIIEKVGEGNLIDGIFLDGDGSSQLYSNEASLPGDNRSIVQMIRVIK